METYETVLEALGDKTRRDIVACLRKRPASVGEIAAQLPVSRPAVSQHLRVLRECKLVTSQMVGTRNVYQLQSDGPNALRLWLDDFWGEVLGAFAAHGERQSTQDPKKKVKDHHE